MSVQLASAYMQIIPSMQGFQGAIAKEVGGGAATSAGSKFGSTFSGGFKSAIGPIAGIAVAGLGISKLTGFISDSISAVGEWQALNAQSASAVKATGGAANVTASQVHNLATSIEGATSTQAESIQKGANLLLTFKGIRNEAGKGNDVFNQSTKTLVDMARAMGTEPQAAAIQLGKALNDPVKGITALTRVGVTFSDSQKKQIAAMQASGNTMGAQKIILKELNSEFGGSGAAYRATFPGQLYQMRDAVGDFGEKIATAVMPALTSLVGTTANIVSWATNSGIIEKVAAGIGKSFGAVKGAIGDFLDGFSAMPGSVGASLAGMYGGFAGFGANVRVAFLTIRDTVGAVFATIGPTIRTTFGGIIAAVGPSIPPLVTAFGGIGRALLGILPALSPVGLIFRALLPVLPTLAGLVAQLAATIGGVLAQAAAIVVPLISSLVRTLSGVFVAIMPTVVSLVGTLSSVIRTLAPAVLGVLAAVAPLITTLVGQLAPILVQLVSAVLPPVAQVLRIVAAAVLPLVQILAAVLIPVIRALLPVVTAVFGAIVGIIRPALQIVVGVINVVLGVLTGNWAQVWRGLAGIVGGALNLVVGIIRGVIGIIVAVIGAVLNIIVGLWNAGWARLSAVVGAVWGAIVSFVTLAIFRVRTTITNIVGSIVVAWNRYWNLILTGLRIVWGLVTSFVTLAIFRIRTTVTNVVGSIVAAWNRGWNMILTAIRVVWGTITSFVTLAIFHVKVTISNAIGTIQANWNRGWNTIITFLKTAWNAIVTAVKTGVTNAINFVKSLPDKAVQVLSGLGKTLFNSGKALIGGFIDGIKSMIGTVGKVASDIVGTVAKFFPHSPAKEGPLSGKGYTTYSGHALVEDFAEGMDARTGVVRASALGIATAAHPTLRNFTTPGIATVNTAGLGVAGSGFPSRVTLVDSKDSILGHMDVRIDRYDMGQQLAGAR